MMRKMSLKKANLDDLNSTTATIAGYSNETLARLGADETNIVESVTEDDPIDIHQDTQPNPTLKAMLEADLAITNGRIKFMESDAKAKELVLAEKELELNNMVIEVMELNEKLSKKDNAIDTIMAKLNSVEEQLEEGKSKAIKNGEKLSEADERIKLLQKALKKYMQKASTESPPKAAVTSDEETKRMKELRNLVMVML